MRPGPAEPQTIRFGRYAFDVVSGRLTAATKTTTLRLKTAELLHVLLVAAPEPVSKEEILAAVWPNTHIADSGLARLMNELRAALAEEPNAIETLPKRGYRLTLPINSQPVSPQPASPHLPRPAALVLALFLIVFALGWRQLGPSSTAAAPMDPNERQQVAQREFQAGYRAWGLWSAPQMEVALERFHNSARVAPDLWFGYVGIADAYLGRLMLSPNPDPKTKTWARHAAERGVRLGPEVAVAHSTLGSVALLADWDWEAAEQAFARALELNAFSYVTYQRRGLLLLLQTASKKPAPISAVPCSCSRPIPMLSSSLPTQSSARATAS